MKFMLVACFFISIALEAASPKRDIILSGKIGDEDCVLILFSSNNGYMLKGHLISGKSILKREFDLNRPLLVDPINWKESASGLFSIVSSNKGMWLSEDCRLESASEGANHYLCTSGDFVLNDALESSDLASIIANYRNQWTNFHNSPSNKCIGKLSILGGGVISACLQGIWQDKDKNFVAQVIASNGDSYVISNNTALWNGMVTKIDAKCVYVNQRVLGDGNLTFWKDLKFCLED